MLVFLVTRHHMLVPLVFLLLAPLATGLPSTGLLRGRTPTLGLVTSVLDELIGTVGNTLVSVAGRLPSGPGLTPDTFSPPGLLNPHPTNVAAPVVDLGYARYQGYYNAKVHMNIYRGQPPFSFESDVQGDEDCLFLNVFQPANATGSRKLPVMVYIHGGGYNQLSAGMFDFSHMDQSVGNDVVIVLVQYRLGAFGFASSPAIARRGVLNVGLHDQRFALRWVQRFARRFGGDATRVTIAGESAGGGSVMLMAMANGGEDGTSLWTTGIASSPYLPTQPNYDDPEPTEAYRKLAVSAACLDGTADDAEDVDEDAVFDCLSAAPTLRMQNASAHVNQGVKFGQWAFKPVTDGTLIRERPTTQLLAGRVNGARMLTGNNANEGKIFVPQNITTEEAFRNYLLFQFPGLQDGHDLAAVLGLYAAPVLALQHQNARQGLYDSNGLTPPFATVMSHVASGWQQAANNLYGEVTFVCPAYWLADAYAPGLLQASSSRAPQSGNGRLVSSVLSAVGSAVFGVLKGIAGQGEGGKMSWRYQFSVPEALHGADLIPLQSDAATDGPNSTMDIDFRRGFQGLWSGMLTTGRPNLPLRRGPSGRGNLTAAGDKIWKPWGSVGDVVSPMLNVNATKDGTANFAVVDGLAWEGGRAARCAMWAALGGDVIDV